MPVTMASKKAPEKVSFPLNTRSTVQATALSTPNRAPAVGSSSGAPDSGRTAASAASATPSGDTKKISSQRLNPNKCSNPFETNTRKCKSTFSQSYVSGSIPCRLHTSASKFHLHWDEGAASGFSPDLLVVCADGLCETEHPYVVLAPMMFHELVLRAEGCREMFTPVVEPITAHIRKALMSPETFDAALTALTLFAAHAGQQLAPQLTKVVPVLARFFNDRKKRDAVMNVLGVFEQHCGGAEVTKLIRSKIPTY